MPDAQLTPMPLHPERELAVAYARRTVRQSLSTLFALDERLGTIVARAREPGIGMIRLLWWRDALIALGFTRSTPAAEGGYDETLWERAVDRHERAANGQRVMIRERAILEKPTALN